MPVESHRILVDSRGHCHVIDLSKELVDCLARCRLRNGTVTLFVIGSTAALSTVEYEPGLVKEDLRAAYERLAPEDGYYLHEETWHDDNGHSHVRATITGPSVTIPLVNGRLTLGTWQQVVLIDFDTRPRKREIVVQVLGE